MAKRKSVPTSTWAVVTGASSGIGFELSKVFAKNGYNVLMVAEDYGVVAASDEILSYGTDVIALQIDLSDYEGVDHLCTHIAELDDSVDAVVLSADTEIEGSFEETNILEEIKIIELNVISTVHLAKHMINYFKEQGHGKMLFASSAAGEMSEPYHAVYEATRAFVQSFAEGIKNELQDARIAVNVLQPGASDSKVAQQGFDALMTRKEPVVSDSFHFKTKQSLLSNRHPASNTSHK